MSSPLTRDDPERIGGYWLAARLGAGGQGVVYEAYDASGTRYALKTLHRAADPFLRERFTREAEAARRVTPFCTARIVLAGVDGDVPYLVSEYVAGPTLAAAVREDGPPSPDAVLRLATGVATALSAIHQAGVVHRDLKPGNVLLGPDGPRIIDFGIARAPDMSLTATGAIMGTFGYMAPEVLAGQRATEASDVFAWAAVVLYAATGTEPFRGENIAEVAHRTTTVEPDLSALPPEIRPLLAAALAKDPRRRPAAAELLMGLVGAPVRAADPRAALMEAGARGAVAPADAAPKATGAGGTVVEATLGERAEAAFDALAPAARLAAHGLLLRLCVPGAAPDGSQDSVRTAPPAELLADRPEDEQEEVTAAVQGLMAAGVLVAETDGAVRPASAALLPAWRRLRSWVDADRPGITVLQRIVSATRLWQKHGERPEDLLRGTELRGCLDWVPTAPYPLRPNPLEQRFLAAGRTAAARAGRRRRQLLAGLAGATALALLAGGLAWTQSRDAERRRTEASARAVAGAAANLPATDPETAMLLGLASWRIAEVPEARAALTAAAVQPERSVVDLGGLDDGEEKSSTLTRDGRRLIVFSSSGIRIFDMTKGRVGAEKPLVTLSPDDFVPGDAGRPAFSPDGRLMLLAGKDGTFRLIRTEDGTPAAPPVRAQPGYAEVRAVSNSGHMLLSNGPSTALVDRAGNALAARPGTNAVHQNTLTPDGKHFVECGEGELLVSALRPQEDPVVRERLRGDGDSQCLFEFSADGRYMNVATGRTSRLFDLTLRKMISKGSHGGDNLRFGSDGNFLVGWAADGEAVEVRERGSSTPLFEVAVPTGQGDQGMQAGQLALDERAQRLRYVSGSTGRLYEIDLAGALADRPDEGVTTSLSAGGRFGLVLSHDSSDTPVLRAVDLRDRRTVGAPVAHRPVGDARENQELFSAVDDAGRIVAYSFSETVSRYEDDHAVVVRDIREGKDHQRIPVRKNHRPLHLGLSPDGRWLSLVTMKFGESGAGSHIHEIWDVERRTMIRRFDDRSAQSVFSRDSERLMTASGAEVTLDSGALRRTALGRNPGARLSLSPDGRFVAVLQANGWLELWDGAARERKALIPSDLVPGAARFGQPLGSMAFSDDGSLLAVAVQNDSVQLWDTGAGLPLGKPLTFTGQRIDSLAFDGTTLRTVSGTAVRTLDLSPDRLAAQVCRRAGRDITPEEWRTYIPDAPYRSLC
ncbi:MULTISPECIES: WD40 repeat domain-containing serine/threonine-protein kinase [Streptomyces]|uniref:WD40 repeat domain-containing serine/threonine-protein kinase n=1 Tax=Streptomyces TaxID=1883 RepID=UPI001300E93E|nr:MULTISPECIES: WD40 repeat domain-containing serine/threonine-protein kinase [unclassified Streptomyces]QNQ38388.1 protein kinase [Streptomyces sp. CB00271]